MAHTIETRMKIAESLRRVHAENPRSESSRRKSSASMALAHAEGRAGGFRSGNRLALLRGVNDLRRCVRIAQQACVGKHGFGKMHLGRQDHAFAKSWIFKSPGNERIECSNLLEWCRRNEHRFPPDDHPRRMPLWRRAAMGIGKQASTADPRNQWRGWRLEQVGSNWRQDRATTGRYIASSRKDPKGRP